MGPEILGVVVDQRHQLFHQLAQGAVARELRHDDQQSRIPAGQDLQRPDLAPADLVAAHRPPQTPALPGVQRLQAQDPEQLEERLPRIVQPPETTGGGGEQDDLGLRLQHPAKLPAEVAVDALAQRLQVLDHEHELPAQPIRRLQDGGAGTRLQTLPAPPGGQLGVCILQLPRDLGIVFSALSRQVEQRFEPEVGQGKYLLALFHELDRQEPLRQCAVGAQLSGGAGEQHGLPATARGDDQDMLA